MGIVAFNFTEVSCEKKGNIRGNIEVKHNIDVKSVEKSNLNIGSSKSDILKIGYQFEVLYGEKMGRINVLGEIVFSDTPEIVDEIYKQWKDNKALHQVALNQVYAFLYDKVILKAMNLAEIVGLPWPIPKPKVDFAPKTKKE